MPVALLGGFILFENIPEQPLMQPARGFSVVIPVWKELNTPFKDPCCEMPQLESKAALSQTKRPYYLMVTHGEVHDCCLTKFQEAFYHSGDLTHSQLLYSSSWPTHTVGN